MQSAFALTFLLPLLCAAQPAMLSNTGCHKFQEKVPTYLPNSYYVPSDGEDEQDHGFTAFDDEYLFKCKPFLDSSKTYYLADVSSFDDEKFIAPGSTLSTLFGSVEAALNPHCAQNVLGHWCHTFFKECQEVDEGVWVPALMCRSACEERKAVWDTCVGRIEEAGLLSDVNTKLSSVTNTADYGYGVVYQRYSPAGEGGHAPYRVPECDISGGDMNDIAEDEMALSLLLGRLRSPTDYRNGTLKFGWSLDFPKGMTAGDLYPQAFSTFTTPDEAVHEVSCFEPAPDPPFTLPQCPDGWVSPTDPYNVKPCVKPCISAAYSDSQYDIMWGIASFCGVCGVVLNGYLALTWFLGGRKVFDAVPFQLRFCVFAGLLYTPIVTLPALLLKNDVACDDCKTEECAGESWVCALNRSGVYVLFGILLNLCVLMHKMLAALGAGKRGNSKNNAAQVVGVGYPVLLVTLAYFFDDVEHNNSSLHSNGLLNLARHNFSCSMRFSDMTVEWFLLWAHFLIVGVLTVGFSFTAWWRLSAMQKTLSKSKSKPDKKLSNVRRRLLMLSLQVSMCLLLNMGAVANLSTALKSWSESSSLHVDCTFEGLFTHNFDKYGFTQTEVRDVCSAASVTNTALETTCKSSCSWVPQAEKVGVGQMNKYMNCATTIEGSGNAEALFAYYGTQPAANETMACDCPCDAFVDVEEPLYSTMVISHLAQTLVLTLVGLNMGFRAENLKIWTGSEGPCLRKSKLAKAQATATIHRRWWKVNQKVE